MSTNKVYGVSNKRELIESKKVEFIEGRISNGINEEMSIDNSTHSLLGVSKKLSDLMVQNMGSILIFPLAV